ncbi:MAG: glycine--tRNA ligase [Candidatus Doudnabacteria bacterium RIFCSPHIGHO2_01_FULL_50_67]|nr:MAG: glycine--tRNA ligase [Candidatus Doudnabacteria bacterium RIFCSPHIGHO2_01_FULL_50_67]
MSLTLEKIVNLAKRRGFIFPGSEIYGGLANSYDFGPLGVELKNNIKKLWWKMFVQEREDMVGLDANIIMNPKVWEASGHLQNFNDPLAECKKCHQRFRADEIGKSCPNCGGKEFAEQKQFNMMFKTNLGPIESPEHAVYLRPETAQAMFVDFKEIVETTRMRVPFGVAQIGKAFRNEITPGNFVFRTREFEQMEIEYFIREKDWKKSFDHWLAEMKRWIKAVGIDEKKVKYVDVPDKERAHYSKRTVDVEFQYPFGQKELYGLAYRTDFDLSAHQKHSGKDLEYRDPETNDKFVPHVIEPSLGVERTALAVLLSCYEEIKGGRTTTTESVKEQEVVLRLPKSIAPIKAAILPLSRKDELTKPARDIYHELQKEFICQYDETASIGKRYRRQDEIGTPFCVTFDFDSLEDKKVTVRDRDSMKQERVAISELKDYLKKQLE